MKNYTNEYGTVNGFEPPVIESCKYQTEPIQPVAFHNRKSSKEIIFHIRGNICEWASDSNVCFGGSWGIPFKQIIEQDIYIVTDTSNIFTGFRNISEWKYWVNEK